MERPKLVAITAGSLLILVTFTSSAQALEIAKYGVFEHSFTAGGSYNNPYTEITATATFERPGGGNWTIPLFWDGGDSWKVRISPDREGTWLYTISSSDPGLDGQSGSFECMASNRHGGIIAMPDFPYHFQYQDGIPFWWFGDTQWKAFGSLTSEQLNHEAVIHYIDVRAAQGFNYIHANIMSPGRNEGGEVFGGVSAETLNPAFFREMDSRVQYMNSKGITAGIMFAWANGTPSWEVFSSDTARLRYARYVVARYSAYNVVFIVSGEYNETGPASRYTRIGEEIVNADPHERMVAIHSTGSVETFADENWMSFGDYQQVYSSLHSKILGARDHNKPVVNSEYAYFLRDSNGDGKVDKPNSATLDDFRHASWDIVMAGGYFVSGFGTTYNGGTRDPGTFNVDDPKNDPAEDELQHIRTFFKSLPWWRLQPDDTLISGSGTHYCLAEKGNNYVAYIRGSNGDNSLSLGGASGGTYTLRRFDPRTGTWADLGTYTGTGPVTLDPPDEEDWLFVLSAIGGANLPPSVSISARGATTVPVGSDITFDVRASDADGTIESHVWHWGGADEPGAGPPGSVQSHAFDSAGDFDVHLTVTDDDGASTDSNHIVMHVVTNLPPVIDSASASPDVVMVGEEVVFNCSAHDPENDPLKYRWDFEDDGTFDFTGQTAAHVYDTAGHYDPVVQVSDGNSEVTRQLTVDVDAPGGTMEIQAEADTYVHVQHPDTNYGNDLTIELGGPTAERIAYIRFNVSGLPAGSTVTRASLRVKATNGSTDPTGGGTIRLYAPSDPNWDEMQPTWNDPLAGSDSSAVLDTIGPISIGGTYHYQNLQSVVRGNGSYTFVIRSLARDGCAFRSSEYSVAADRPTLIIDYATGDEHEQGLEYEPDAEEQSADGESSLDVEQESVGGGYSIDAADLVCDDDGHRLYDEAEATSESKAHEVESVGSDSKASNRDDISGGCNCDGTGTGAGRVGWLAVLIVLAMRRVAGFGYDT